MGLLIRLILVVAMAAQALPLGAEPGCATAAAPERACCCCANAGGSSCEMSEGCGCTAGAPEQAPASPPPAKDRAPQPERTAVVMDVARVAGVVWGREGSERRTGSPAVCRFEGRSIQAVLCVWLT
jgi:hypothetical protein